LRHQMAAQSKTSARPHIVGGQLSGICGQLIALAFDPATPVVTSVEDASQGRGVFSDVWRIELEWPLKSSIVNAKSSADDHPNSVVAKIPTAGPNSIAAMKSGAYDREHHAYTQLLVSSEVQRPRLLATTRSDGKWSFLLEDLSGYRSVSQIDGLERADAVAVGEELAVLHREWGGRDNVRLGVRGPTVEQLTPTALDLGIKALQQRWSDFLEDHSMSVFEDLLANRESLVRAFSSQATPTLCHGDPRADNLVFDRNGRAVMFDWQQIAFQHGEADLAWLAATSLKPEVRKVVDNDLVESYGGSIDRYRLGFALPGLAVLLLAQRDAPDKRTQAFIAESLVRISTALIDFEVASYV